MESAMNQTLKLFIMHFFVLYVAQVVIQVGVIIIDYASDHYSYTLGVHALDFLSAADLFIVFLFMVELSVQILVHGMDRWIKNWWHRFDLFVLIISVLFVTIDISQISVFPCEAKTGKADGSFEEQFELFRDLLRLVRIILFLQQLGDLLSRPWDHFAMMAEDLGTQAEEVNDFI